MNFHPKIVLSCLLFGMLGMTVLFSPSSSSAAAPSAMTAAQGQAKPESRLLPPLFAQRSKKEDMEMLELMEAKKQRLGCRIKGNAPQMGNRKIYHMPESRKYKQIRMNYRQGDRWFCSEQEAKAAGFVPARR